MEGNQAQATPPAAPVVEAPPAAPQAPTPPAPPATPPGPTFEAGGQPEGPWTKNIPWLQVGLVFFSVLGILSVTQYYRIKSKNLKSEIPAANKKITDLEQQVNFLADSKLDKKSKRAAGNSGFGGLGI